MEVERSKEPAKALAPAWHTAALVALMLVVAAVGTALGEHGAVTAPVSPRERLAVYMQLLVVNLGLLFYVSRVGLPGSIFRTLLGRVPDSVRGVLGEVALSALAVALVCGSELVWQRAWGTADGGAVNALLPRTPLERAAWVVVAATVGCCEEVVYRGYLQTQLASFTRRPVLAVLLQAALFALAHGEQGAAIVARVFSYGVGFGALSLWRRSLLPGMLCHIALDLLAGLVR
jgi:uncharacterized protein